MMMVYYFSFALIFLFLVVNVSQYINISKSQRFIRKEMQVTLTGERRNRLIVLIPVMDEHKIINETIMYFNRILSSHPDSLLVFVTTQKEGRVEKNKTYQKILPYLSEKTLIIHYPFLSGNKAHQINYAVERLGRMQKMGGGPTYYGVFDADSRPDPRGLDYVAQSLEEANVYQMLPVYSTNFDELSLFGKASAIFQTRWMMSYELPTLLKNYQMQKATHLSYCIGHGLFIRQQYFEENLFPVETVTEDLLFGYRAVMHSVYAKPVPYFDYCSSVSRFSAGVRQSARWHAGDLSSLMLLMGEKSSGSANRFRCLKMKRMFTMLQWPLGPVFTIAVLCVLLALQCWPGVMALLILIGSYVFLLHSPVIKYFFPRRRDLPSLYGALLVKSAANCLGALYSYFLRLNPKVDLWFKTPR
ncbi:hypothetical protein SME38J_03270 [Serratia marcescens]|nr:hypothetical protein SME38J_03270 [Serratia marcescens]